MLSEWHFYVSQLLLTYDSRSQLMTAVHYRVRAILERYGITSLPYTLFSENVSNSSSLQNEYSELWDILYNNSVM